MFLHMPSRALQGTGSLCVRICGSQCRCRNPSRCRSLSVRWPAAPVRPCPFPGPVFDGLLPRGSPFLSFRSPPKLASSFSQKGPTHRRWDDFTFTNCHILRTSLGVSLCFLLFHYSFQKGLLKLWNLTWSDYDGEFMSEKKREKELPKLKYLLGWYL